MVVSSGVEVGKGRGVLTLFIPVVTQSDERESGGLTESGSTAVTCLLVKMKPLPPSQCFRSNAVNDAAL